MGRKYIRLCTNHQENKCYYQERFDISYLFHDAMHIYGEYGSEYFDFVPTQKNMEWIRKYYDMYDFTECYFDKEPRVNLPCTHPDYEKTFIQQYRDEWNDRMKECCWYEPYQAGIWGGTSEDVNNIGYVRLEEVKKLVSKRFIDVPYNKYDENSPSYRINLSFKGRMFTTLNRKKKDDYFSIYWFGRDIAEKDYIWSFQEKW